MAISNSALALQSALRNRAWIQWVALGVDATVEPDDAVVDPEALIAMTAELGDADARLLDVSTDWCVSFGRYVNGARLRQVVRELGTPIEAIGEYVATVATSGGPTWPMAARPRTGYAPRGKARLESASQGARLHIRLRAAFGVNARADVLAALLSASPSGMSIADLARRTRFTKPNVASVVDALALAELISARTVGNERRVFLVARSVLPALRAPIPQPDWVSIFGVALTVLRFMERDWPSQTVRAIEARRLVEPLLDRIEAERLPEPAVRAFGDAYAAAFERWVADLAFWLRRPSRS